MVQQIFCITVNQDSFSYFHQVNILPKYNHIYNIAPAFGAININELGGRNLCIKKIVVLDKNVNKICFINLSVK